MRILARHPDAESLRQYAERTLDGDERLVTANHLQRCTECRETVKVLRELSDLEGEAHESPTRDDILDRVLAERAGGARTILPTAEPARLPVRLSRVAIAAGIGVVAITTVVSLFSIRNVSAGSRTGSLSFDPAAPQPGQVVRVTYEPNGALSVYDSLVLRARFRRPGDDDYNEGLTQSRVGVMRRSGGEFKLDVRLPDSVVFAVFAVESPAGDVVDDNDQQLWEIVTTDDTGKPLYDALLQKRRDMMGRNWEETLRTARRLAALYPDDPDAAAALLAYERWVLGDRIADSLLPGHRKRFAAFQAGYGEQRELPTRVIAGMAHFAGQLDDSAASHVWRPRFEAAAPNDPEVILGKENKLREQYIKGQKDARGFFQIRETNPAYFQKFEPVWQRVEPTHDRRLWMIAQNVVNQASMAKDTAWLRVWAGRFHRLYPGVTGGASWMGRELLPYPTLRDTAMTWLRDAARLLAEGPDAYRPLTATIAEQQDANRGMAQPILAELGNALIENGNRAGGLDTLRLAASYGWNPDVLRSVARALMARGDTAAALQSYARVVADPGISIALKDSINALVPRAERGKWPRLVQDATQEMRQSVLQRATPRSLSGSLRLMTKSGEVRRLTEIANGRVTVVMFWTPYCGFSLEPLHDLDVLNQQFASKGAQIVSIVDQPFSNELEQTMRVFKAGDLPVFYDFRKDAQRAFASFATPNYFVLDSSGRLMFEHSSLAALPRQVAALVP
ncbi:MAG TPA: redoxin family protein [Gemmatimonadales bacterium]|jgi:thiol-disulfide isomerase/thioredoxin